MTRVIYTFGGKRVANLATRHTEVEFVELSPEDEPPQELQGEVLLSSSLGSPNMATLLKRGVRWVHILGTGVDRFPFELLSDQTLTCSRGASAVPISEWVMAHILAYEKRLPEVWLDKKPDQWFIPKESAGTLVGKKLAILGLGAIATETAKRALAFGMSVKALRRTKKSAHIKAIDLAASPKELLEDADFLLVACALTPRTKELVDAEFLSFARPGLHFLNIARGEIVNETDLRQALDNGIVARASLDTAAREPLPKEHWIYEHPKVTLTPHISWSEPDAMEKLLEDFEKNLRLWQAGEPLQRVVNTSEGY